MIVLQAEKIERFETGCRVIYYSGNKKEERHALGRDSFEERNRCRSVITSILLLFSGRKGDLARAFKDISQGLLLIFIPFAYFGVYLSQTKTIYKKGGKEGIE